MTGNSDEDSEAVAASCCAMVSAGLAEAGAAPIVDSVQVVVTDTGKCQPSPPHHLLVCGEGPGGAVTRPKPPGMDPTAPHILSLSSMSP